MDESRRCATRGPDTSGPGRSFPCRYDPGMATRPPAGSGGNAKRLPADRRRQQLLDVALKLFAQRGFNATTMDDIAEAAGVTKPLLYQHFASKRALYLELLDSVSHTMLEAIGKAIAAAGGPRQQVEGGFAAYFHLVVTHADAFHLLFGSDVPNDPELSRAVRKVEDSIAESIDVLIDAGLEEDHRRLLAFAVVGMAEGASRHFLAARRPHEGHPHESEATRLARRLADLAWAGLRSVHRD
jgi:AcrR family transcriptional regulator